MGGGAERSEDIAAVVLGLLGVDDVEGRDSVVVLPEIFEGK